MMKINGIGVLTPEEEQCLIPLEASENALFSNGKDGVKGIYSTLDKKLELIEFDDKTLAYVKSSAGHPALYELKKPQFAAPAKAVLMDLDGTSVHSESFWIWIIEQVTAWMLKDENFRFKEEDLPHVSGYSVTEHLSYCIKKYAPDTKLQDAFDKYFEITEYEMNEIIEGRGKPGAFTPAPHLKEFLYTLKGHGVKIGLVTSGLYQKAWPEILNAFDTLGMGDPVEFYDAIITAGTAIRKGQAGTLGEIEAKPHPFEMLEIQQKYEKLTEEEKRDVVNNRILKWNFLKPANDDAMMMAAGYYLAVKQIAEERNYKAISLKDVDGMKKLCGFPPAPIFMLLSEDGYTTVPENDSLGAVTQLMMNRLTGQLAGYLEFYEFFDHSVLAGVPDFVASDMVDGDTYTVIPAAFGALNQGILNVSKVKTGTVTMSRLTYMNGKYVMQMVLGNGKTPPKWEECGWDQPAPQLSALEIILPSVERFADNVACQHYIITYGDNRAKIRNLCAILGIEVFEM